MHRMNLKQIFVKKEFPDEIPELISTDTNEIKLPY